MSARTPEERRQARAKRFANLSPEAKSEYYRKRYKTEKKNGKHARQRQARHIGTRQMPKGAEHGRESIIIESSQIQLHIPHIKIQKRVFGEIKKKKL